MRKIPLEKFLQILQVLGRMAYESSTQNLSQDDLDLVGSVDQEELESILRGWGLRAYRTEVAYRKRRKELEEFSTERLQGLFDEMNQSWSAAIAADVNDEAGDSLYSAPSRDSDYTIISDILEKRGVPDRYRAWMRDRKTQPVPSKREEVRNG